MLKRRALAVAVVCAVLVLVGIGLGLSLQRWASLFGSRVTLNGPALLQQVQTVSELVTVKYVIERVVVLEDVKWIAGLGENRVLLLAHGNVKAGIDLSQLGPGDLQVSKNKVVVKLPPARIMEAYLDEQQTRVIERTTGLLRVFDKDLEQTARQNAVDDIRRAARTGGILKDADARARAQLTALLKQLGFETVEFRSK